MIAALVMAAGASSRLGRPKQLLRYRGKPLVRHAVDAALEAGVAEVVVVVGHEAEAVAAAAGPAARCVLNPRHAEGLSASLRAGLSALGPEVRAAVVLLADQPGVGPEAVRAVLDAYERTGGPVVRARYGGLPGHPVVLGREAWPALEAVRGDRGAREVLDARPEWVVEVELGSEPPLDVDTPEDADRLQAT